LVVTSKGAEGVTGAAPDDRAASWLLAAVAAGRVCGLVEGAPRAAEGAAASPGTASPLRGAAGAVFAGWAGVTACWSAGLVTVPRKLKSRSWDGPIVSAEGGGAAVTSTGASLSCAAEGVPRASASAAAVPLKALKLMRRDAVILPRLAG
jgi:hypothetical protein